MNVGPEYIEPGRRPGPNRSPIAAGFRDCAGSGTVQGLEEHKSCSVMEERRRAAFPDPSNKKGNLTILPRSYNPCTIHAQSREKN